MSDFANLPSADPASLELTLIGSLAWMLEWGKQSRTARCPG